LIILLSTTLYILLGILVFIILCKVFEPPFRDERGVCLLLVLMIWPLAAPIAGIWYLADKLAGFIIELL
jgi:uncharacterized membrane protein